MSYQGISDRDCPVELACDYGNASGHGYWIVLTLRNGKIIRGPCYDPEGGIIRVHVDNPPEEKGNSVSTYNVFDEPPTFVRCSEVAAATVEI